MRQQQAGLCADKVTRVGGLVVVHGQRKRHEQRPHAGGGQFGNRQCARAANQHVGIAVHGGHVVHKFDAFGRYACRLISSLQVRQMPAAGLVGDARACFFGNARHGLRHGFVQGLCAQAAADNENPQRAAAAGKTLFRFGKLRNVGADGVAHQAVRIVLKGFGEGIQHARRPFGQAAVRHAGHGVLFVDDNRNADHFRRHAAGKRNKAAKADNGIDFVPADNVHGSLHATQQHPRQGEFAPQTFAAHAFHRHRFQGNAVLRHQALFHAALAAEPHDFMPHLLQRLRHGQRGENVPAGAACHH